MKSNNFKIKLNSKIKDNNNTTIDNTKFNSNKFCILPFKN